MLALLLSMAFLYIVNNDFFTNPVVNQQA